jgi:hypothetical protein
MESPVFSGRSYIAPEMGTESERKQNNNNDCYGCNSLV